MGLDAELIRLARDDSYEIAARLLEERAEGMESRARGGLGSMFASQSSTDLREAAKAVRALKSSPPTQD